MTSDTTELRTMNILNKQRHQKSRKALKYKLNNCKCLEISISTSNNSVSKMLRRVDINLVYQYNTGNKTNVMAIGSHNLEIPLGTC
jgi:thiamine pyrophosphokinase